MIMDRFRFNIETRTIVKATITTISTNHTGQLNIILNEFSIHIPLAYTIIHKTYILHNIPRFHFVATNIVSTIFKLKWYSKSHLDKIQYFFLFFFFTRNFNISQYINLNRVKNRRSS